MRNDYYFKIMVLDDSEFYNSMFIEQLNTFTNMLSIKLNYKFDISSYISSNDFIRNLKLDTDVIFLDYYLGNGITAPKMLKQIKEKCKNCKAIVISQVKELQTTLKSFSLGAVEFIFKDKDAIANSCYILENILADKDNNNRNNVNY